MLKSSLLSLVVMLGTSACVVGAPPGFSDGDLWEVPLVAPLENDLLLVPVSINDNGPFLFMIDPDSEVSSIESSIQNSLNLYAGRAGQVPTEEDHLVNTIIAQVPKMTIGDLQIRNMRVRVHTDGTYWSGGRRVHGILGRDAISDSLIYSFDRDRGMMYIGTQGHIKPKEDALKLGFSQSYGNQRRYLATIKLNRKHKLTMHMDLGARTSMLWPNLITKYKLPTIPVQMDLVDELGTKRSVSSGTMAGIITAGKTETNALLMLPYSDKRIEPEDLDGVIGQNFWSKYNTMINWHQKKIWLQPRNSNIAANAQERIERWGDQLKGCEKPACVSAFIPELAAAASEPAPSEPAPSESAPGETAPSEGDPVTPPVDTPVGEGPPPASAPGYAADDAASAPIASSSEAPGANIISLVFERDAPGTEYAYDVVVAAVDAEGKTMDLPLFLVHFRSGISSLVWSNLDPDYASAAGFTVVDMNPVGTRGCEGSRCIYPIRAPR